MFEIIDRETLDIIGLTLRMTLLSTFISAVIGIPLGLWLEKASFAGKMLVVRINRTLMATPPVVAGLVVYLMLMRDGPLGFLRLLFTFEAMVIAQVILISPIICGMVYTSATRNASSIRAFAVTMGASGPQTQLLLLRELGNEMYFALITGFGRAMSEVGAIMIVGGNIRFHTRAMTTTISMLRNQGEIDRAIFMGVVLMAIAFVIQLLADIFRR
ncbi:MAG: ABC transporter permease, partial [Clostridiales bacterium]|nr:ABC transporter permease [Clostridiales bacterium]